ncbi:unnamed protein product [Strongylus vulgaris]|uniref:Uncharacterized protein n=1 Tax=Strongylus vulgaris TaxID=40348 RepID=A0A3P7J2R5_STRVU|nr:unnamed protein product [Strongylus vulgaris]
MKATQQYDSCGDYIFTKQGGEGGAYWTSQWYHPLAVVHITVSFEQECAAEISLKDLLERRRVLRQYPHSKLLEAAQGRSLKKYRQNLLDYHIPLLTEDRIRTLDVGWNRSR